MLASHEAVRLLAKIVIVKKPPSLPLSFTTSLLPPLLLPLFLLSISFFFFFFFSFLPFSFSYYFPSLPLPTLTTSPFSFVYVLLLPLLPQILFLLLLPFSSPSYPTSPFAPVCFDFSFYLPFDLVGFSRLFQAFVISLALFSYDPILFLSAVIYPECSIYASVVLLLACLLACFIA